MTKKKCIDTIHNLFLACIWRCDEYDPKKLLCRTNYIAHCCCAQHMWNESIKSKSSNVEVEVQITPNSFVATFREKRIKKMSREDDIDEMCQLLAVEWKKRPNHRLGQFLLNFIFYVPTKSDLSMWNQQDTTTKKVLEQWEALQKKKAREQKSIKEFFGGTSGS